MRRSCLAASLTAAVSINSILLVGAGDAHGQTWSLGRAIDHGLQHSPKLKAAASQLEAATLRSESGKLAYYPSLDVTATHGAGRTLPEAGTSPYRSNVNITVSQLIYDFGLTKATQRTVDAGADRASLAATVTREQFILDVGLAYYRLAQARRREEASRTRLSTIERQRRALQRQVQQGFRAPRDLIRLDALSQRGATGLSANEASVRIAVNELARLIGLEATPAPGDFTPIEPLRNAPQFPQLPPAQETLEARLATLEQKQADLAIDLIRHKHTPQLKLAADAGYGASDYMGTGVPFHERDRVGVSAALTLQYALWDGGRKKYELATALADKASEDATRADRLAGLAQILKNLAIEKEQRLLSFTAAQKLLALEQDNYTYQEKAYREGKASYLDLVTAIEDLSGAQAEFDSSYFGLLELKARYHFYQGTTYDALAR